MNPETQAWIRLRAQASAQLSPGFADRVLRAAQGKAGPSLLSQFALSAATAAACFLGVAFFSAQTARADATDSVSSWQQIASASEDLAQAQ